jgi:hypothetical protein
MGGYRPQYVRELNLLFSNTLLHCCTAKGCTREVEWNNKAIVKQNTAPTEAPIQLQGSWIKAIGISGFTALSLCCVTATIERHARGNWWDQHHEPQLLLWRPPGLVRGAWDAVSRGRLHPSRLCSCVPIYGVDITGYFFFSPDKVLFSTKYAVTRSHIAPCTRGSIWQQSVGRTWINDEPRESWPKLPSKFEVHLAQDITSEICVRSLLKIEIYTFSHVGTLNKNDNILGTISGVLWYFRTSIIRKSSLIACSGFTQNTCCSYTVAPFSRHHSESHIITGL